MILALHLACSLAALPPLRAGAPEAPVLGGTLDDTTDAAVAITLADQVVCSGSLVGRRAVLTAAHCTWFPGSTVRVQADLGPPRHYDVAATWRPAGAAAGQLTDDIAVVELEEEVSGVDALMLGELDGNVPSAPLRVVGYGRTEGDFAGERRSATIVPTAVEETTIRFEGPGPKPCRGDSGGPALTMGDPGEIVAVVSHGDPACEEFVVFERVDAHLDFLEEALARIEGDAGTGCRAAPRPSAMWLLLLSLALSARPRSTAAE